MQTSASVPHSPVTKASKQVCVRLPRTDTGLFISFGVHEARQTWCFALSVSCFRSGVRCSVSVCVGRTEIPRQPARAEGGRPTAGPLEPGAIRANGREVRHGTIFAWHAHAHAAGTPERFARLVRGTQRGEGGNAAVAQGAVDLARRRVPGGAAQCVRFSPLPAGPWMAKRTLNANACTVLVCFVWGWWGWGGLEQSAFPASGTVVSSGGQTAIGRAHHGPGADCW